MSLILDSEISVFSAFNPWNLKGKATVLVIFAVLHLINEPPAIIAGSRQDRAHGIDATL
jgi:hypothetical protein